MQHIYLVFSCKTENCPAVCKAAYLGPFIPGQSLKVPVAYLNWGCETCRTLHPYTHDDMRMSIEPHPPDPGERFPLDQVE